MAMRGAAAMAFVLLVAAVAGPVSGTVENGLPRPTGYPDVPTEDFGSTPPCLLNGVAVTCEWYGFSHEDWPVEGAQCNVIMRAYYSNTTNVPIGRMKPYVYYFNSYFVFDKTTNDSYCLYGCFDMTNSGAAPSPSGTSAPPPAVVSAPPPTVLAPSPLEASSPPPPAVLAPPPLKASSPPPPLEDSSPPPSTLLNPPPATTPTSPSPPGALTPPAVPPGTSLVNLNGAGFLRPEGFLSFVLSAALLSLIGLAAF